MRLILEKNLSITMIMISLMQLLGIKSLFQQYIPINLHRIIANTLITINNTN